MKKVAEWIQQSEQQISKEFGADVIRCIASTIAKDTKYGKWEVEEAITSLFMGRPASIKTGLQNVVCTLEKVSASQCRRTLEFCVSTKKGSKRYVVNELLAWEDIPRKEKEHFIRTGDKSVSWSLYEKRVACHAK